MIHSLNNEYSTLIGDSKHLYSTVKYKINIFMQFSSTHIISFVNLYSTNNEAEFRICVIQLLSNMAYLLNKQENIA